MLHIILLQSKLSSRLSSHYRILTKSRFLTTNISTKSIANELKVPIDLIRTFPELAKVSELRRLGKLKQALEAVTFTYDILVNATGFTSIQSKSLRRLQIALQFEAFDKKSSSYSNIHDIKIAFTDVDEFQVDGLMLLSAHRLVSNDLKGAIEAATAAVEACEDTNISPSIPVQCFSPAYGLKGLTHLLQGEVEDADTYLQMSARWSQSPVHTILALNNLGASYWLLGPVTSQVGTNTKTHNGEHYDAQKQQQDFSQLPISNHNNRYTSSSSSSSGSGNSRQLLQADIDRIRVAIDYWTEAANVPVETSSASVNTSASMCGGAAGSVTSGAWSGAGNVLSSDDSVQYHSFTSGSSSNSSSSNSGNSGSGNNTSDTSKVSDDTGNDISTTVSVAIARCGVLCNLAEAHNALGDVDRATKRLSEALKALKSVQDVAPYQCAPALGHVLGLLAYQSMYSSQAVTAEGLFRASLDYFNKNQVVSIHDCRLRYEMAIVRGRQGLLLSKWDKRESEGQALVKSSEEAIATEYAKLSVTSDKRRIILTSMTLQIPL